MKKNIVGLISFIALFVFVACNSDVAITSTAVQIPTVTPIPATATTTMSAGFASLLSTETPIPTPELLNATALPITGTPQPLAIDNVGFIEQEEIKEVIQSYFDARHRALSTLKLEGFNDLISNDPEATAFWEAEVSKLKVELKHAELNNLRYAAYEYFLDYKNASIDLISQRVAVSVSLRQNIIYEISVLLTSGEPIMSSMYNEEHTIVLQKKDEDWKIISDIYNDYLWRRLRQSETSADEMLRLIEAQPINTPRCFTGVQFSTPVPEHTTTPGIASSNAKIKAVYLDGKNYDPEWFYSFPFTNLYFEADGESILRFIVELDDASAGQVNSGWQIVIYSHVEDEKPTDQSVLVLGNTQEINCDSRTAFLIETSLEEIRKKLGNHRIFDYQVVNENGDIKLEHSFYLNPYGSYLISDTFGDMDGLDGGIIGYPNLMDENKAIFPRERKAILVREPRGGFFQLHYLVRTSNLQLSSGIWTEETSDGVIVQIFLYRDDGIYDANNSYTLPNDRKIRGKKNYNFEVYFTIDELREALGEGNEFYIRILDKDGNFLGEDYFYFAPYSQSIP